MTGKYSQVNQYNSFMPSSQKSIARAKHQEKIDAIKGNPSKTGTVELNGSGKQKIYCSVTQRKKSPIMRASLIDSGNSVKLKNSIETLNKMYVGRVPVSLTVGTKEITAKIIGMPTSQTFDVNLDEATIN